MSKLICLQHPKYTGKDSPVLSCKTCCGIFISLIKDDNSKSEMTDAEREQRRREVIKRRAAASNEASNSRLGFSPIV